MPHLQIVLTKRSKIFPMIWYKAKVLNMLLGKLTFSTNNKRL
jgi:hypothetical protein